MRATRTTSLGNGDKAAECGRRDLSPALQPPILVQPPFDTIKVMRERFCGLLDTKQPKLHGEGR